MLSLQQVTLEVVRYRWFGAKRWSPLLEDISFELAPGELVALVGGSGEGKSLLLQSLLDLLPDNIRLTGKISLNGSPVDNHRLRQLRGKTFSYVPQGVQALNPMLDVQKHLQRAYQLTGKNWNIHHVTQLLAQNQLESSVLRRYPRQLSGGMAKRVLACHAALSDCRYILADEITAWLDAPLAHQLMQQLQGLCKQGYGVLWVTHDLMLAGQYADRIVSLHRGRVSDNLSREQLLQGEMSEQLKRQWQALPEKNLLFV
ncbi:ATP-binding cassette domain-containing protein [Escherichia fergusonii]|uniref:ATP-binding cassette domain-containing protein n=1 Tax=Escherichia fergusonii TaxID=564 RepID=UPI0020CBA15D|nr:ATP-binding cassette domain-containing protein [Escherichia fergusonii]MCP9672979.1 ATP-binding cassette domain-containing protein [Escherichia fergusonii]